MAKPKFDFDDEQNLIRIEGWARDGLDDKQIAANIGYSEAHFSVLKGKLPKLSKALKNGRAPIDFAIESKIYRKAMGMKVKVQQAIKVKDVFFDEEGRRCEKERVEIVELDQEVPPDTTAGIFWLKNRKPEQWNRPAPRAEDGIRLINGAGSIGLMRSVADAVLKNGGEVTGVIPRFMVEQNWHHTGLTELIEVESMHERKRKMADLSDGIIALPGGCGTLEELLEIITWKQLGLYLNPIVILNINGFFDPLLEMLEKAIDENFMRRQHGDIWKVAQTPEEAVQLLYETPVWDISIRKFAAI